MKSPIFVPKLDGPSAEEVAAARAVIEKHNLAIEEQRKETLVQCQVCKALHKVSDLTYVQTHYYIFPHGCTGGDYWVQSEGRFPCKCGHINRLYRSPDVVELKRYFAKIENTYIHRD